MFLLDIKLMYLARDFRQAARGAREGATTPAGKTGWIGEGTPPPRDLGRDRGSCWMGRVCPECVISNVNDEAGTVCGGCRCGCGGRSTGVHIFLGVRIYLEGRGASGVPADVRQAGVGVSVVLTKDFLGVVCSLVLHQILFPPIFQILQILSNAMTNSLHIPGCRVVHMWPIQLSGRAMVVESTTWLFVRVLEVVSTWQSVNRCISEITEKVLLC